MGVNAEAGGRVEAFAEVVNVDCADECGTEEERVED